MTRLDDFYRDVISGSEELVYRTTSEQQNSAQLPGVLSFVHSPYLGMQLLKAKGLRLLLWVIWSNSLQGRRNMFQKSKVCLCLRLCLKHKRLSIKSSKIQKECTFGKFHWLHQRIKSTVFDLFLKHCVPSQWLYSLIWATLDFYAGIFMPSLLIH